MAEPPADPDPYGEVVYATDEKKWYRIGAYSKRKNTRQSWLAKRWAKQHGGTKYMTKAQMIAAVASAVRPASVAVWGSRSIDTLFPGVVTPVHGPDRCGAHTARASLS